jgi:ABC-type polysaccharide/polyol phosphate export permease
LSYLALQGRRKRDLDLAWRDLKMAAARWHLIIHIAWLDVRQRYRRSVLGPIWLTISIGIQIGAMGFVYGELFRQDITHYLPRLAVGLTLWGLIAGIVTDSCYCFIAAESWLKQEALPKFMFPARMVARNLLIFAHNLVILIAVVLIFQPGGWSMLLALPGLLLIAVNGIWIGLLVGLLCTRFRDLPPIIASFMQVAFFITPVIWVPETLHGHWWWLITFNPFANFLAIVSDPMLGTPVPIWSWPLSLLVTAAGWAFAFQLFGRFRARITYWL